MISGAREGKPNFFRRWFGTALASNLKAYVVPGPEFARLAGLDLAAAGIELCHNPRLANLLLIVGPLPPGLGHAAAIIFSQMPRPRAILFAGEADFSVLPAPDVRVGQNQPALLEGVTRLRKLLAENSWVEAAPAFPFAEETAADTNDSEMDMGHHNMAMGHHGQSQGEPNMGPHEMPMDHAEQTQMAPDHQSKSDDKVPGENKDQMNMGDGSQGQMEHGNHINREHGGQMDMDMGGGGMQMGPGFMSMVAMTKNLPRSRDGLPMEWAEAPFGPLHPGLPAGLALTFTLDGDSVAKVKLDRGLLKRDLEKSWPGSRITDFPERFSRLEPTTPLAYRFLAIRALAETGAITLNQPVGRGWIGALEQERLVSHLGWLAKLGEILGYAWLTGQAGNWQLKLTGIENPADLNKLRPPLHKFIHRLEQTPLLKSRLVKVGKMGEKQTQTLTGPLGRATGKSVDGRNSDTAYKSLGFSPVKSQDNDAFARLKIRLLEIRQSLDLIEGAENLTPPAFPGKLKLNPVKRTGTATVETPRGPATLTLGVQDSQIETVRLETPSDRYVGLVTGVCQGAALVDALVGVASLDLSAWELDL